MKNSDISIAISYVNRVPQLRYTLSRLHEFEFTGEIVISDDFSEPNQSASQMVGLFPSLDIKVVYPQKNVMNPAHSYNNALSSCTKQIVIIQNPECVWVGDIAEYVADNLTENQYFSFACLNATEEETKSFNESTDLSKIEGNKEHLNWYQHSIHRNRGYHFCSAIYRTQLLNKLNGGFDERFNEGYCFDDNEFIFRVKQHLDVVCVDNPYVIHQHHSRFWESSKCNKQERASLFLRNKELFELVQQTYNTPKYKGLFPNTTI